MRNQTNNVFKVKRQKSKIFITILCIFGLLFSYSCQCKNNVSDPNNIPPNGTNNITTDTGSNGVNFTATLNTNSFTDLIFKVDNTTNSVVNILFDSEQNISAAEITSIKTKEGETIDVGLTTADIKYNLTTKELEVTDAATIGGKLPNRGDKSTIVLSIKLTSDTTNLNNTTTTVDVDVNLIKTKELGYTEIYEIFKAMGNNSVARGYDFNFSDTTTTTYSESKITIKNNSERAEDANPLEPSVFKTEMEGNYGFQKEKVKALGYISSAEIEDISNISISGTTATFFVVFTFNSQYEAVTNRFQIDVEAKNEKANQGKWKTTETTAK